LPAEPLSKSLFLNEHTIAESFYSIKHLIQKGILICGHLIMEKQQYHLCTLLAKFKQIQAAHKFVPVYNGNSELKKQATRNKFRSHSKGAAATGVQTGLTRDSEAQTTEWEVEISLSYPRSLCTFCCLHFVSHHQERF